MELVVKNLPANARDIRDVGSIPGSGRSPGEGHAILHVFFPGKSHRRRRLVGRVAESDVTEPIVIII